MKDYCICEEGQPWERTCKYHGESAREQAFKEAAKPLIKFLNDFCNPHTSVIVTNTDAELVQGELAFNTIEYLKD